MNPARWAAKNGKIDILRALLNKNADVNVPDSVNEFIQSKIIPVLISLVREVLLG